MTEQTPRMTSHRPYLLRALSEWIADNDMTPHLLVDATQPGVQVPPNAVKEGKVVLNIAQRAVARLQIDNTSVSFSARFGGVSYPVSVPISAVLAIYARETGQGMALPEEADVDDAAASPIQATDAAPKRPMLSAVPAASDESNDGDDDEPTPPSNNEPGSGPKRPQLRVVK